MASFATVEELEASWKGLNEEEKSRATALLDMASSYLRQIAANNRIDLDQRIEEAEKDTLEKSVKMVVMQAVKRSMSMPQDAPPADQWSQSANPYSETIKFTNPSSDLFFKKSEIQLLGLNTVSGRSQISLLRGAR